MFICFDFRLVCLFVLISGQAFVFYFPFIFALNALSGVKYLGAIVLCEWMNLNLKWSENKNYLKDTTFNDLFSLK
jgi:hypothetical protein